MNIEPFGKLQEKEIKTLEDILSFELPKDYRDFLIDNNGGVVKDSLVRIEELSAKIFLDVFYGISLPQKVFNLYF